MTFFVMSPVFNQAGNYMAEHPVSLNDSASVNRLINEGLSNYRTYLIKHTDPELAEFFVKVHKNQADLPDSHSVFGDNDAEAPSILTLLPAYALSEIKSAFKIGFYIYLPFIIVDLLVSNILLALGMMMMSPVTIALPIKLVLFVAIDGWSRLSQGLIMQYIDIWRA